MSKKIYQREIKKIVKRLKEKYHPEKIYLFGSFVWGKFTPDSDVDLLIIKKQKKENWIEFTRSTDFYVVKKYLLMC